MQNKKSVEEFISDINYMLNEADPQEEAVVQWLYQNYVEMFENECGFVPNFEINNKGQITLLPPEI